MFGGMLDNCLSAGGTLWFSHPNVAFNFKLMWAVRRTISPTWTYMEICRYQIERLDFTGRSRNPLCFVGDNAWLSAPCSARYYICGHNWVTLGGCNACWACLDPACKIVSNGPQDVKLGWGRPDDDDGDDATRRSWRANAQFTYLGAWD